MNLRQLEQRARTAQTPCGTGLMAWRNWGCGRPLLLLHGGHGSWTHWVQNIEPLVEQGYEVWVPDLPGFGGSSLPPSGEVIGPEFMLQPLREGLRHVLGNHPCEVAAFSFGTMVAGLLSQAEPDRVRGLVLVGAAGLGFVPPVRPQLKDWRNCPPGAERDTAHAGNLRAQMLVRPGSCDTQAVMLQAQNASSYRLRGPRNPGSMVLANALSGTATPVAAIWGKADAMVGTQHALAESAIAAAPGYRGTWWIEDAGHWVMYDAPREFNAALREALAACARAN